MRVTLFGAALFALVMILLLGGAVSAQETHTPADICAAALPAEAPESRDFEQPDSVLEAGVDYRAIFCTDAGAIYVDLFEDYAPVTVNSFVFLARQNYYNDTIFHRVIPDFMAQGGDPTGTGSGGPGYQFQDEFVGFLYFDKPGFLAMANAGAGTNGSQFFITTMATEWLNYQHTIFGEVLDGYDNVLAIQVRDPQAGGAATALQTVIIIDDPAQVSTQVENPVPADYDMVLDGFNTLGEMLPPDAGMDYSVMPFSTEETLTLVPGLVQDEVTEALAAHGHEYRVNSTLTNTTCTFDEMPFTMLGYTLDAYASEEEATAALNDPALEAWLMADGFSALISSENIGMPLRYKASSDCDTDGAHGLTQWQRGRFVITAEVAIPLDNPNVDFLDLWLEEIVGMQLYEYALSDVLRREIR